MKTRTVLLFPFALVAIAAALSLTLRVLSSNANDIDVKDVMIYSFIVLFTLWAVMLHNFLTVLEPILENQKYDKRVIFLICSHDLIGKQQDVNTNGVNTNEDTSSNNNTPEQSDDVNNNDPSTQINSPSTGSNLGAPAPGKGIV